MRSMRSIQKDTDSFSKPSDDNMINTFVWGLYGVIGVPVFTKKIFGVWSCWKFYHRCGSCSRVDPEICRFFPHIVREIFTNYFLIN